VTRRDRFHVVIAGGGVAALEILLALRAQAGHLIDVTLLSPATEFVYRPVTVAEAFDRAEARVYDLVEILDDQGGGELIQDTLADVEVRSRIAVTGGRRRIPFDALVVATGAVPRPPFPGAFTFRGRDDVPVLRGLLHDLTGANVAAAPVRARADDRCPPERARGR
jgi:sulfide:quinone oxidoreductase